MYTSTARAWRPAAARQFLSNGPALNPQIASRYASSRPQLAAEPSETMFKKAVKDHSTANPRPLQSTLLGARGNVTAAKIPPPTQSLGVKRKIEMTTSSKSALGSLHNAAVYFDENDFDDDDDLDFSSPDPFIPSTRIENSCTEQSSFESAKTTPVLSQPENSLPSITSTYKSDIKYPDLPPIPPDDPPAPTSSIQLPWSSSPPSHFQKPTAPRTVPWQKQEKENVIVIDDEPTPKPKTPARPASTAPWNKTASAIKEEQKELRRQSKKQSQKTAGSTEHAARPQVAPIFLSDEQRHVLKAVVEQKKSIFFTGSAGTGKSVLMREIIKQLRNKFRKEPDRIAVTASTGLAACNIEGVTLHSFAGIGLGKEPVQELVKKIKKNQKARNRWLRTKVLIIDEVSMVDGDLFDKLEEIARSIRNNGRPFGGIQLVVTGDFFQLPPVPEGHNREAKFSFAAGSWNTSIQHTILLTHVFRQRDPEFAGMLNEMRLGKLSPQTTQAFMQLSRPLDFHDSLEATELFPTRNEVDSANAARMGRLSGETMTFTAVDSGTIKEPQFREKLLSNCMAPPVIHLKKGSQVMLIKNMEESLVNGSIGRVVAFMDESTFDMYIENEGDFTGGKYDVDDEELAAARARKKLKGMVHKEGAGGVTATRKWPLVCFIQPDGSERHLLCQPETWKIELPSGEVQAQRQQVPLILAWALSIHKAQGQTLQRVKVDLGKVFEKGQAYVALSRATSKDGLQVLRFDPRKVMVHPKVIDFYKNLVDASELIKSKQARSQPSATGGSNEDFDQDYLDDLIAEASEFR